MPRCCLALYAAFLVAAARIAAADPPPVPEAQASAVLRSLQWIRGPASVPVALVATMPVPQGYVMLVPSEARRFLELLQDPSNGREYLLAPADLAWFALLDYAAVGHVADDERLDAASLLGAVQAQADVANDERRRRGWPPFHLSGWRAPPAYDRVAHRVDWAIDGERDGRVVTNVLTKILGRDGVTSAVLAADPAQLARAEPAFRELMAGYAYTDGHRYTDYRAGDPLAPYGLAGLVAGEAGVRGRGAVGALPVELAAGAALLGLAAFVVRRRRRRSPVRR